MAGLGHPGPRVGLRGSWSRKRNAGSDLRVGGPHRGSLDGELGVAVGRVALGKCPARCGVLGVALAGRRAVRPGRGVDLRVAEPPCARGGGRLARQVARPARGHAGGRGDGDVRGGAGDGGRGPFVLDGRAAGTGGVRTPRGAHARARGPGVRARARVLPGRRLARAAHRDRPAAPRFPRPSLGEILPQRQASRPGESGVDDHSLRLLEFDRVTATMAERAATARGAARLSAWRPIAERPALLAETALLREAIRRNAEPGEWCTAAGGEPGARLDPDATGALDGPGLVEVLGWLEAARATRAAWDDAAARDRHPALAALVTGMPVLEALRATLARALEPDGRLADGASPALGKLRRGLAEGERALEEKLGRWAKAYGAESYVTRHADRFVALVPSAGFPRRRGIVHDVSGSGQSLFVEPLEMCEANNHLLELRSGVATEEARLLRELAGGVIDARAKFLAVEAALVHLDTLRARARWAAEVGAIAVEPGPHGDGPAARGRLRLRAARHPLLALGERRASLVPLDLDLEPPGTLLLVSGPNMGGK